MDQETTLAAWIGLDWANQCHTVCLHSGESDPPELIRLENNPEEIHCWVRELRVRFGGKPVGIAVEQSRGPLIYALMSYDFLVLYPVNPKALAKYREAFRVSGSKDDPGDAWLLLDLLCKHRDQLTAWKPEDSQTRALRLLVEQRRKLVEDRTRLLNRLRSLLKEYFPQILEWFSDLRHPQVEDFLLRWSSLPKLQKARRHTLLEFFQKYRCRGSRAEKKIESIRRAVPLTEDPAVMQIHSLMAQLTVSQLQMLQAGIDRLEKEIQELFDLHPNAEIFQSFPGAGKTMTPRLLVAFGTDRDRFDASRMQGFSGIAPVTQTSGNARWVHHRFICNKFLKQTFHEYALYSLPHSIWAKAYYQQQREKGSSHHEAARSMAYKWIRILTACWQNSTTYCEQKYIEVLRSNHSPLYQRIQELRAA